MDAVEMSSLMDVLWNNITSNQAPGLSEYEKSVFLTKAEDEITKNYFNPKSNKLQEGYDGNQKRQIDFSAITVVDNKLPGEDDKAIFDQHNNSRSVALPDDVWMIINEKASVYRDSNTSKKVWLVVKPISFEEYDTLMSKPFKRPLKYQAWRLINNDGDNGTMCDIIVGPSDEIVDYTIRYVKRPKPIIIGAMDEELSINGYTWGGPTTPPSPDVNKIYGDKCCELDPILHEEIVQRAVELAKIAWQGDIQASMTAGTRSE